MNGLINQHLIELLAILVAVLAYIVLHFAIKYTAVFMSGQKKGIIRQCLQGFCAVACFIGAMLLSCNGAVRYYHVVTYTVLIVVFYKLGAFIDSQISKNRKHNNKKDILDLVKK